MVVGTYPTAACSLRKARSFLGTLKFLRKGTGTGVVALLEPSITVVSSSSLWVRTLIDTLIDW